MAAPSATARTGRFESVNENCKRLLPHPPSGRNGVVSRRRRQTAPGQYLPAGVAAEFPLTGH